MNTKDQDFLLHLLRNPHGWGEEAVREARLKAADELSRLWKNERCAASAVGELSSLFNTQK